MKDDANQRKTSAPSSISLLKGSNWPFRRCNSLRDYGRSAKSPSAVQFSRGDQPLTAALRQQRATREGATKDAQSSQNSNPAVGRSRGSSGEKFALHHQKLLSAPNSASTSRRGSLALDTLLEAPQADAEVDRQDRGFKKGPHVVVIYRGEHGFGFTLRHFIVYPPDTLLEALERKKLWQKLNVHGAGAAGGADLRRRSLTAVDGHDVFDDSRPRSGASTPGSGLPTGYRDPELEPMDTIFVKNVHEGGPAHLAGLLKGDRLLSVNGEWIQGRSYAQVIQLIQRSPPTLTLVVVPEEDDVLQQYYSDTAHNPETNPRPHELVAMAQRQMQQAAGLQGRPGQPGTVNLPVRHGPLLSHLPYPQPYRPLQIPHPSVPVGFSSTSSTQQQQPQVKYHPIFREGATGGPVGGVASSRAVLQRDSSLDSALSAVKTTENAPQPSMLYRGPSLRRSSEHTHKMQQEYRKSSTRSADVEYDFFAANGRPSDHVYESLPPMVAAGPGDRNSVASVKSLDFPLTHRVAMENAAAADPMLNRIRKSFEKKAEFLMRTESPTFSMPKQFYGHHPEKLDAAGNPTWPPTGVPMGRDPAKGTEAYDALLQAMSHALPPKKLSLSIVNRQRSVDHHSSSESIPMIDSSPPADGVISGVGATVDSAGSSAATSPLNRYFNQLNQGGPRVPSLRLVSRRAHQFESGAVEQESSNRLPFYQSELARLTVKTPPTTVEAIKQGFERSSDSREPRSLDHPAGVMVSSQHSTSSRLSSSADARDRHVWETPGFDRSAAASGNRTNPIGGSKIHAEPPSGFKLAGPDVGTFVARLGVTEDTTPHHPHYYHHQSTLGHTSSGPLSSTPTATSSTAHMLGFVSSSGGGTGSSGEATPVGEGGFCSLPVDLNLNEISPISRIANGNVRDSMRLSNHRQSEPSKPPVDVWVKRPPVPNSLPIKNPNRPADPSAAKNAFFLAPPAAATPDDDTPTPTNSRMDSVDFIRGENEDVTARGDAENLTNGVNSATLPPVVRRRKAPMDDAERIQRRSSYLKATGDQAVDLESQEAASLATTPVEPSAGKTKDGKRPVSDSSLGVVKPASIELIPRGRIKKLRLFFEEKTAISQRLTFQKRQQQQLQQQQHHWTQNGHAAEGREGSGQSGVNKLLSLFGDNRSEAHGGKASSQPSSGSFSAEDGIVRQGILNLKTVMIDGKRAGDRSWKTAYAVLRSYLLYFLHKEKRDGAQSPLAIEEQPAVDLRGSTVELASDYTKKKNVFRILLASGQSEYLLQADTASELNLWIQSLQEAASIAKDPNSTGASGEDSSQSIMGTSADSAGNTSATATTPSMVQPKGIKKLTTSLRHRSPSGHSPVSKTRKPSQASLGAGVPGTSGGNSSSLSCPEASATATTPGGADPFLPSPKSRTWRGRVARQFRKIQHHSSSSSHHQYNSNQRNSSASSLAEIPEGATIGIPIDMCPMSATNECLPVLVELCTSIIESRGLSIVGVYRVPGNNAAVSALTESVNKGFDQVDMSDPRWSDVNVISSLLKSFFRKLPDPLVSSHLYSAFMDASTIEEPVHHLLQMKKLVRSLPEVNYETLRHLIIHLARLAANQAVNKMDPKNLAIVFGPNLIRDPDSKVSTMVSDMAHHYRILESLIVAAEWIFDEDEELNADKIPAEALERGIEKEESPSFNTANHSLYLNNAHKIQELTGGNPSLSGIHETKDSLVSSVISAAHRKTKLSSLTVKSSSSSNANSDSGKRAKKDISSPLKGKENFLVTKSDEAVSTAMEEDSMGPRSLPPLPTPSSLDQARARAQSPALAGLSTNSVGLSSSADDVVKMDARHVEGSEEAFAGAIKSYSNLSANTQERIRRFELETKAMLRREVTRHQLEARGASAENSSDLSGGSSASLDATKLNSAPIESFAAGSSSYPRPSRLMAPLPLPSGLPPHMQAQKASTAGSAPSSGAQAGKTVVLRPPGPPSFFQAGAMLRRGVSAENLLALNPGGAAAVTVRPVAFDVSKVSGLDTLKRARFPRPQQPGSVATSGATKKPVPPLVAPQIVMSPVAEEGESNAEMGAAGLSRRPSHHVRYGSLDSLREFLPPQDVKEEDLMQSITASLDERLRDLRSSVSRKENLYMPLPSTTATAGPKQLQLASSSPKSESGKCEEKLEKNEAEDPKRQFRDPSLHRIATPPIELTVAAKKLEESQETESAKKSRKTSSSDDDKVSLDSNQNLSSASSSPSTVSSRRFEERRNAKSMERRPVSKEDRGGKLARSSSSVKEKLTRSESLSKSQRSHLLALISQGVLPNREGSNIPVLTNNQGSTGNNSKRDTSKVKTSVKELKEMFEKGLTGSNSNNSTNGPGSGSGKASKGSKKNGGRKIKRRHTVGGTKDFEKFRRVFQQAWNWNYNSSQKSNFAWDRLSSSGGCGDSDLKTGWMRTSSPELSPKAAPVGGINWVEIMSQEAAVAVAAAGGLVNLEDWERFKRNSLPLGPIVSFALQSKV